MQQRQALAEDVGALQPGVGALRGVCGECLPGLVESLVDGDAQFGFHVVFICKEGCAGVNTL
ncbi:hypothetical protein D3C80_2042880 [compost metagenome]